MHTALGGRASLADLADVEVAAVVELGQTKISLQEARRLTAGDTITLTRLAGEPYRVSINDHPFGEGEAVVVADQICLRLTRLDPTVEDQHGSDMPAPSDLTACLTPPAHQAVTVVGSKYEHGQSGACSGQYVGDGRTGDHLDLDPTDPKAAGDEACSTGTTTTPCPGGGTQCHGKRYEHAEGGGRTADTTQLYPG